MDVFLLLLHMHARQPTAVPPYTWHQDVCMLIQREAVEEGLKKAGEAETKKAKKGAKAAKAVDIEA